MKSFLADWRNPALLIAIVLAAVLGIVAAVQSGKNPSAQLVQVGSHVITQGELQQRLKSRRGDGELMHMINERIVEEHATRKGVLAESREIDQLIAKERYAAVMQDTPWADYLERMGHTSEADLRADLRTTVFQVKLTIAEEELRQLTAKVLQQPELAAAFTQQPYIQFRRMRMSADEANEAIATLEKAWRPEGERAEDLHGVRAAVVNTDDDGMKVRTLLPGRLTAEDKKDRTIQELLKLAPGKCAQWDSPTNTPDAPKAVEVVQLVKVVDKVTPGYENAGMIIGQVLLLGQDLGAQTKDPRLAAALRQLQGGLRAKWSEEYGHAIRKASITFYTSDYPTARARITDAQKSYGAGQ